MNLETCKVCKRLFQNLGSSPICPDCKEELEAKFLEARSFVEENPGANLKQIARACDVKTSQVQEWIKEERLVFEADSPNKVPCEHCGAMIRSGHLCEACQRAKAEIIQDISQSFKKPAPKERSKEGVSDNKNRMRFIDNRS